MKKSQFSIVRALIIFLVVSLVLLFFSTSLFDILKKSSSNSVCQASAIANSVGNTVTLGSDVIKLDCPIKNVYVTEKKNIFSPENTRVVEVNKPFGTAEKSRLIKNNYYGEGTETAIREPDNLKIYRINEAVANEMKTCWDNLGQGKLNLFSSWFQNWGESTILSQIQTINNPPTVCVICSRIEIDEKLYEDLKEKLTYSTSSDHENNPSSLIYFLGNNPVPNTKVSYYEYLLDENMGDVFGVNNRNYKYNSKNIAVVFARTNPNILHYVRKNVNGFKVFSSAVIFGASIPIVSTVGALLVGASEVKNVAQSVGEAALGKDSISAVYLTDYNSDDLEKYCTVLAN